MDGKGKVSRRVWSRPEEDVLIIELKKLVANGWRVDNAFRTGYLLALEHALAKKFPGANITGNKHINSKLTVWKKVYKLLLAMFSIDGFRYDPTTKMIVVDSDEVWDNYLKEHPDVENMRFKSYPFYKDWCMIFGNDGINIDNAQGFVDALEDLHSNHSRQLAIEALQVHAGQVNVVSATEGPGCGDAAQDLHSNKGKQQAVEVSPVHGSFVDVVSEADDDARSVAQNETSGESTKNHRSSKKLTPSRKRKAVDVTTPDPMVQVMGEFLKSMNSACGNLLKKFNFEQDTMSDKSKRLLFALGNVPGITDEAQVLVSYKLVNNPVTMELFLNMNENLRSKFVQMMLDGKLL